MSFPAVTNEICPCRVFTVRAFVGDFREVSAKTAKQGCIETG